LLKLFSWKNRPKRKQKYRRTLWVSLIDIINISFSTFYAAYHIFSNSTQREGDEILSVKYEDGRWSKPYYDCGGGNIWMLTYTVPFFGYDNGTYFFK
jgi:hypothetical protein